MADLAYLVWLLTIQVAFVTMLNVIVMSSLSRIWGILWFINSRNENALTKLNLTRWFTLDWNPEYDMTNQANLRKVKLSSKLS